MKTGTIKTIRADCGYLFLVPDHDGPHVFCHIKAMPPGTVLSDDLLGREVSYHEMITDRGPRASDVRFLNQSEPEPAPSYGRGTR